MVPSEPVAAREALSKRQIQILQVATGLFQNRGYHGTRMDDVAAGAEINKATIYHYFPAKSDILYLLCLQSLTEVLGAIGSPDADEDDPLGDLAVFTVAVLDLTARELPRTSVYFQEAPFIDQWLPPEQVATLREMENRYDRHITGIFERGERLGVFAGTNARVAALGYTGMLNWFYRWYHVDGPVPVQEIAAEFLRLVVTDDNVAGVEPAMAKAERARVAVAASA